MSELTDLPAEVLAALASGDAAKLAQVRRAACEALATKGLSPDGRYVGQATAWEMAREVNVTLLEAPVAKVTQAGSELHKTLDLMMQKILDQVEGDVGRKTRISNQLAIGGMPREEVEKMFANIQQEAVAAIDTAKRDFFATVDEKTDELKGDIEAADKQSLDFTGFFADVFVPQSPDTKMSMMSEQDIKDAARNRELLRQQVELQHAAAGGASVQHDGKSGSTEATPVVHSVGGPSSPAPRMR